MNEATEKPDTSLGSTPCITTAVFALPAVACWIFAKLFVFPVLIYVWLKTNPPSTPILGIQASRVLDATRILFSDILILGVVAAALVVFVGRRTEAWSRNRRLVIGAAAWIINAVVLLAMTFLCIGLAFIAHTAIP